MQGLYPCDGCKVVNVELLVTILEESAASHIIQLAEVHHMHKTYCLLHMEVGWLRTKQYSPSALFRIICCALIIISMQSIV
jgi:hypothetical protein